MTDEGADPGTGRLRFDDGKDADALRTIGELARAVGVKQHVLRYWEQQFPMLQPLKRSGGRRYYRPEDAALVHTIDRLVNQEGYTLKGARHAIEKGAVDKPAPQASEVQAAGPKAAAPSSTGGTAPAASDVLPKLREVRERLAAALAD